MNNADILLSMAGDDLDGEKSKLHQSCDVKVVILSLTRTITKIIASLPFIKLCLEWCRGHASWACLYEDHRHHDNEGRGNITQ